MILLDTCVLLWLASDAKAISTPAGKAMKAAPDGLFVSAISAFEVGQKVAAGKISLRHPVDVWFAEMIAWHGLHEIPLTSAIAARATLLPTIHRDPFDRILIATAQAEQLTLLTPDVTIAKYPDLKIAW